MSLTKVGRLGVMTSISYQYKLLAAVSLGRYMFTKHRFRDNNIIKLVGFSSQMLFYKEYTKSIREITVPDLPASLWFPTV